jgi:Domain of unknown function (DUF397)
MIESSPDLTHATWYKSSYSNGQANCVEVAHQLPGIVAVRDSKNRSGPALVLAPGQWEALLKIVRTGGLSLS